MSHRKQRDGRFKAQVALEAIKNQQIISQIASEYGVNPAQVSLWKKLVLEELPQLFTNGRSKTVSDNDELVADLYRQIGQLKVELDWLKKNLNASVEQECRSLSVVRQCELLGLPRASYYYRPATEFATKPALYESVRWTVHQDTVLRGA